MKSEQSLESNSIEMVGHTVFSLVLDGQLYELHLEVVSDSPVDCRRFLEPVLFKGDFNSQERVLQMSWQEAQHFLGPVKYDHAYFEDLKWILENGGWAVPKK